MTQSARAQTPTIVTLNPCAADADCVDDGNLCTLEVCSGGFCTRRSLVEEDNVDCTEGVCDTATGVTTQVPYDSYCVDNNACTQDLCTGTGNEPIASASGGTEIAADPSVGGTAPTTITGCEYPPNIEVCNSRDDDCDRQIDEGFNVGASCTVGVGACTLEGTIGCTSFIPSVGTAICPAGYTCTRDDGTYCQLPTSLDMPIPGGSSSRLLVEVPAPTSEICDGIDNDCDGQTDDDCSLCGNGIVEAGETCDDGTGNGQPNRCNITCSGTAPSSCGNLALEEGEQCEPALSVLASSEECVACRIVARTPVCGNGLVDEGEECEPGQTDLAAGEVCEACLIVAVETEPPPPEPPLILFPPPPALPPEPAVAVCGNGLLEGEEACDEGVANNNETEGACRTDCSGLVAATGRAVPEPQMFQSEIFDGAKTCTVSAPFMDVDAATTLYPDEYDRQFLVFAGHIGENFGFGFKASKDMLADCRFSFDSCTADGKPWSLLLAGALNDAEPNDLIGVTEENEYRYILDADQLFRGISSEECSIAHQSLFHPEVPFGDRQWSAADGATLRGEVAAIHDLQAAGEGVESRILGAVELRVDDPEPLTVVGLDIFRYGEAGFDHLFFPIQNFDPSVEIRRVRIHAPAIQNGSLTSVNFLIDTHIGSRSVDCNQTAAGGLDCNPGFVMDEAPLLLIDETEVLHSSGLLDEETEEAEAEAERTLMIASDGAIYELREEEEMVETEPAAVPETELEAGVDAAMAPAPRAERQTRRRQNRESVGTIEEDNFNPEGESAEAADAWLEAGAYNMVLTEESAIRGYRIHYNEARQLQVEPLDSEIYTADSVLNNVHSNDTIVYIHPHRPFACLRNDFGGADLCAFFEAVDAATGEKLGTVFTVFDNHNEAPEVTTEPLEPQGQRVFLRIHATDPMEDSTVCRASLVDAQGNDLSSRILCDLENGTLEIDLEGVVEEGSGINVDITNGETSWFKLELPSLFDLLIPSAHAQQSGQTLQGSVCASDAGGAEGCAGFTITAGRGLTAQIPAGDDETGGGTTAAQPTWGLRGGGIFCGIIVQNPANFAATGGAAYCLLGIFLLTLIFFRSTLRGRRGSTMQNIQ